MRREIGQAVHSGSVHCTSCMMGMTTATPFLPVDHVFQTFEILGIVWRNGSDSKRRNEVEVVLIATEMILRMVEKKFSPLVTEQLTDLFSRMRLHQVRLSFYFKYLTILFSCWSKVSAQ